MSVNMGADIKSEKNELRRATKQSRSRIDAERRRDWDADIQSRVLSLREYMQTDIVFTYVSKDIEVGTRGLIFAAWANGKKVAAPKCRQDSNEMDFYIIKSTDDLTQGQFGLLEPKADVCEKVNDFSHGICVVPGLGFDAEGYRLGYGKGYYDRFLKSFSGTSVGLCYSSCVKFKLPRSEYDMPVDMIVTERYVRRTVSQ